MVLLSPTPREKPCHIFPLPGAKGQKWGDIRVFSLATAGQLLALTRPAARPLLEGDFSNSLGINTTRHPGRRCCIEAGRIIGSCPQCIGEPHHIVAGCRLMRYVWYVFRSLCGPFDVLCSLCGPLSVVHGILSTLTTAGLTRQTSAERLAHAPTATRSR